MDEIRNTLIEFQSRRTLDTSEVEIRFSSPLSAHDYRNNQLPSTQVKPKSYTLKSIESCDFHRVLNLLRQKYPTTLPDAKRTRDTIYPGNIRKTVHIDGDYWIQKRRKVTLDVYKLNCRVSMSEEIPIDAPITNEDERGFVRDKFRHTVVVGPEIWYDLTVVNHEKYEIELEFSKDVSVETIMYHIEEMKQMLSLSPEIIYTNEEHNVCLEYRTLCDTVAFLGAQPECLTRDKLVKLTTDQYCLTEKADGERLLMFISDNCSIYFFDRRMKLRNYGLTNQDCRGTIGDCEIVGNCIYIYDILYYKGKDIRGSKKHLLKERMEFAASVVKSTRTVEPFVICIKRYATPKRIEKWIALTSTPDPNTPNPTDGLILTPLYEPYPKTRKWPRLYKWKPMEQTTIDLLVRMSTDDTWNLYMGGEITEVPFSPCPFVRVDHSDAKIFREFNGCVIECSFYPTFRPIKVRFDKDRPNYRDTALSTWSCIRDNIGLYELSLEFQSKHWESKEVFVTYMKKYENLAEFACIVPDGHIIYEKIRSGSGMDPVNWTRNSLLDGLKIKCFGNKYGDEEYLVFPDQFVFWMKKLGWTLREWKKGNGRDYTRFTQMGTFVESSVSDKDFTLHDLEKYVLEPALGNGGCCSVGGRELCVQDLADHFLVFISVSGGGETVVYSPPVYVPDSRILNLTRVDEVYRIESRLQDHIWFDHKVPYSDLCVQI